MSRGGLLRGFLVGGIGFSLLGLALLGGGLYLGIAEDNGFGEDTASLGLTITGGTLLSIGVIWALVAAGVGAWYRGIAGRRAAEAELLSSGTRVTGTIENVEMTATSINENPVVNISVRVPAREGEFVHRERLAVPTTGVPLPGHLIDVAYDPSNRSRVALDFDPRLSAPPARYLRTRPPGAAAAVNAPAGATAPATAAEDRIEDLERLAELKRSGALTDDEFEAEKARILRG